MSETCHIPGCDEEPVFRLKYRDCMGSTCTESRCHVCARVLRDNDENTVLDETQLRELPDDAEIPSDATPESDLDDEAIQRLERIIDAYGGGNQPAS